MTVVESVTSEVVADRKMPPVQGVLIEGPVVDAKFLDSYIAFGLMVGGSIAALVWAFWQGIGWIEISVFAGTFVMTSTGLTSEDFAGSYVYRRTFNLRNSAGPGSAS